VGLFATDEYLLKAGFEREAWQDFGTRLGNQVAVAIAVALSTVGTAGLMFFLAAETMGIRTEHGASEEGLDIHDFGTTAYEKENFFTTCVVNTAIDPAVVETESCVRKCIL